MTAIDALTTKQAVFETACTQWFEGFADHFTASLRGEVAGTLGNGGYVETGTNFVYRTRQMLTSGECFYISPEMNKLVTAASHQWPEDACVYAEDFPAPFGWFWIPGGLTVLDIRGAAQTTVAISWRVVGGHLGDVECIYWADKQNDPPHVREQMNWKDIPRFLPWCVVAARLGGPLPTSVQLGRLLPPEVSRQIKWLNDPNSKNATMFIPEGWTADELKPTTRPESIMAWLVSALKIMAQPLATVERVGIPARVRKGLRDRPRRVMVTTTTIIEFRRREKTYTPSGETYDWSHRWLVRGFWRRQWRGTGAERRQEVIYIHPQIRGPVDKPLILKDHVNAFLR